MFIPDERRSYEAAFFALGLLFGVATIWALVDEAWVRRPWKSFRAAYLEAVEDPQGGIAVQQLVVPKLDVVDRCHTCHGGVDDPRLEDGPRALRTHPNRALLLGAHPIERFGCTPCHGGQGLALTEGGAHCDTDPYWTDPMVRGKFTESRCLACHPNDDPLDGAPTLSRGRTIVRNLGCDGCHAFGAGDAPIKRGPALTHVRSKLAPGFLLQWIREPVPRRPDRRMPQFWPNADRSPEEAERKAKESLEIAAYLQAASEPYPSSEGLASPTAALAERGEYIFDRVGCRGCHVIGIDGRDDVQVAEPSAEDAAEEDAMDDFWGDEEAEDEAEPLPPIEHGPALGDVSARMTAAFIGGWLLDPKGYWRDATMPKMRLTANQAAALAAYLVGLGDAPPEAPAELTGAIDPALAAKGKVHVGKYGCAGCHDIPGFEDAPRVGPELAGFGAKTSREFYYGDEVPTRDERTWQWYTRAKLTTPRRFRSRDVRPVMPDYGLEGAELEAVMVFLRGHRAVDVPAEYIPQIDDAEYRRGAEIFEASNCRGCHTVDGRDGDIARYYADMHLVPPTLAGEGARVRPQWLFGFLIDPRPLRPWLEIQMPTFALDEDDARALVRYFTVNAERPGTLRRMDVSPTTTSRAALASEFFGRLKCVTCHLLDNRSGLEVFKLAPDLGLARQRLDPQWVREFLQDPGAKLPGTRMPQFFPNGQTSYGEILGGDADAQIELLVDHVMNMGTQPVDDVRTHALAVEETR